MAVDKLDKIGRDGVIEELGARGIAEGAATALLGLLEATGPEALSALRPKLDEAGQAAIDGLSELLEICAANPAGEHLQFYPALARGLSYYTGPIFEIAVSDLAGSLGGGGRYDDLVGMFGKQKIPAVGFSLGLERIIVVMEERGMYPDLSTGPEVMLCSVGIPLTEVSRVATALRDQGLRVEVYPGRAPQENLIFSNYQSHLGEGTLF